MQAVVTHTRFLHRPGSNPLSVVSSALYGWFKPSHTRLGFFLFFEAIKTPIETVVTLL